jgi:glycosyltransferase involved in cell wall biosynthesis
MFYCGHHPWKGKGLTAVFESVALLKSQLGSTAPRLKVHAYVSSEDLAALKETAANSGLNGEVEWLNQIPMPEVIRQYQSSSLCLLPFTGSFAGLAAATAAATGLPIVGTKNAGIIEHIGENGIWLDGDNAEEITPKIDLLLRCDDLRHDLSKRLRKRAEQHLSWDVVADKTLAVFERAIHRKVHRG